MPTLPIHRLLPILGEVEARMRVAFADRPFVHEEALFAAAALVLPELRMRRLRQRAERHHPDPLAPDADTLRGTREVSVHALCLDEALFDLQGPTSIARMEARGRERLAVAISERNPSATVAFPEPAGLAWSNPEGLAQSPRLAERVAFARKALRPLLQAQVLEDATLGVEKPRSKSRL